LRYLIDADWVIHYLNGQPAIVTRIQKLSADGIALSYLSLAELYEGDFYSSNPQRSEEGLQAFLRACPTSGLYPEVRTFSSFRR
jgi:tRNA(fMet)-specific endonuclease VapC